VGDNVNAIDKKVEPKANEILRRFGIDSAPVDVFKIAESLGIRVNFDNLDPDTSGVMLQKKNKTSVAINASHHINRQRFTLAHEIGHFLLHLSDHHEEEKIFVDKRFFRNSESSKGSTKLEIEANAFAACLLMPKKLIKNSIQNPVMSDMDIFRLAHQYEVSEQAMTLRLVKLDYIEPD
jgi:Zn-dependent peptidase ImmA (M78 family)